MSRSMSQKIMIHHKLGNFILFKLYMEPSVFNIEIKRNKRKYGVTSTVTMTITSKQCIVVPWKIPILNNQVASLAQFINTCFYKEQKVPLSIFETGLLCWTYYYVLHYTGLLIPVLCDKGKYLKLFLGNCSTYRY
jgi:hypothetical protein